MTYVAQFLKHHPDGERGTSEGRAAEEEEEEEVNSCHSDLIFSSRPSLPWRSSLEAQMHICTFAVPPVVDVPAFARMPLLLPLIVSRSCADRRPCLAACRAGACPAA